MFLVPLWAHAEDKLLTVNWMAMPVHGLAAVVETPSGKVYLVDTGGVKKAKGDGSGDGEGYDAARDTILPYLKSRGHSEIDGIVISHPHADHYGGLEWLLQHVPVKEVIDNGYEGRGQSLTYLRLRDLATDKGGQYRAVHAGDTMEWDAALKVEVLSPPKEFLDPLSVPAKVNDHGLLNSNSVVLRIQYGKTVFVFPGDSYGGTYERFILANTSDEKLKTTVLTANHHGFNPGFEVPKKMAPSYVVTSCLADYPSNADTPNPRSPGDRAMQFYGKLGAEVFVTAFHGNITAVSDGETVTMTKQHERTSP